jgi:diguanylate cyclase (GGDEF)-like protein
MSNSHHQYNPQVLLNSQPVIVAVIDPASYKVVFQNQVSLEKFGDISNQTCHDKIASCATPCEFCKMPEALQSGQITASEVPLPNDEYLLVQWARAETTDGRVHILETITDITQVKRQQKQSEVLNQQLETANCELRNLNQELKDHSIRDGLTGLYNRAYFVEVLEQMGAQAKRSGEPLSLLFLDLDNFKSVNDTYGHTTGDQILREMGRLLDGKVPIESDQRIWRASDVATRYGGEEFAVLLPNTSVEGAVCLAEQLRDCVTRLTNVPELVELESRPFPLSCSIGVATFPTHVTPTELIVAADKALYVAKNAGKNCVKVCEQESAMLVGFISCQAM